MQKETVGKHAYSAGNFVGNGNGTQNRKVLTNRQESFLINSAANRASFPMLQTMALGLLPAHLLPIILYILTPSCVNMKRESEDQRPFYLLPNLMESAFLISAILLGKARASSCQASLIPAAGVTFRVLIGSRSKPEQLSCLGALGLSPHSLSFTHSNDGDEWSAFPSFCSVMYTFTFPIIRLQHKDSVGTGKLIHSRKGKDSNTLYRRILCPGGGLRPL